MRRVPSGRRGHFASPLASLAVLLWQLTILVTPLSGLVLCVAADGHIAIEFPHRSTSCESDYRRHHGTDEHAVEHAAHDSDDHGCHDALVPELTFGRADRIDRDGRLGHTTPQAFGVSVLPAPGPVSPSRAAASPVPSTRGTPVSLRRSVVFHV